MAVTNYERVGKGMELLRAGLGPFVDREFKSVFNDRSAAEAQRLLGEDRLNAKRPLAEWDAAALLKLIFDAWNEVFGKTLGRAERSLVQELREWRNKWAHQEAFTYDDVYRALDSIARLLTAVSASQAQEVEQAKQEVMRLKFDEQTRSEKRKASGIIVEGIAHGSMKPWREVVMPHPDVSSGRYQQAEFAADLWQVHLGQGTDEYKNPVEFFRRTYLTESLKRLLANAIERLSGKGGDPVVQLQTNFGGGKTHSMLALYHLVSGKPYTELAGLDEVVKAAGTKSVPMAKRVVLVGNKISPGNPVKKDDGTIVRTLWGELAWQLGGKKAYNRIKADDEKATSPGDVLRELLKEYGPCLVLIDEWVAYARQLHERPDLPGGGFETQFSFAQVLTESAKAAENCLLVVSLPASDTHGSPHAQADDVEVGGQRGREALDRLRNVVGRLEASWRPASAEEGFEIVRRRLFQPLPGSAFKDRDVVATTFSDFYRGQKQEFPPDASTPDYERRLKAAYPIHPEVFDRLYNDWSTLVKFQRTRGVLRLMAAVIHSLWEKNDRSPLIMPSTIPIDDPRVQSELSRYLSDNWVPVIEKDVDGPNSLPLQIDKQFQNLGKLSATRRVARTIYLGSAPLTTAATRGIEDRSVKLGCVMPGESPSVFVDALRHLAGAATYLYEDKPRYWYSTQPTVTKLAEDRAEQYTRDSDKVVAEIVRRLREDLREKGVFTLVHTCPPSSQEVPDEMEARLVVLGPDHAYTKDPACPALVEAAKILESRGNSPRLYRNALVFLAPDKSRLQDLDEAVRKYLAWESILSEQESLNLTAQQVKQAEAQHQAADSTVHSRLPETYCCALVPTQASPKAEMTWQAVRLTGQDALAARASKKLRTEEMLISSFAPTRLRLELDRVPLWRGDHVAVRQLVEDFARYLYLPRLRDAGILQQAVREGVGLLSWAEEAFGIADRFDEARGKYVGLKCGQNLTPAQGVEYAMVVKPDVAKKQRAADAPTPPPGAGKPGTPAPGGAKSDPTSPTAAPPRVLKRFHGTVSLTPDRAARDAGKIADEVLSHLVGLVGAKVTVLLEIQAEVPDGVPEGKVRVVTENCNTLKFESHGFELE